MAPAGAAGTWQSLCTHERVEAATCLAFQLMATPSIAVQLAKGFDPAQSCTSLWRFHFSYTGLQ